MVNFAVFLTSCLEYWGTSNLDRQSTLLHVLPFLTGQIIELHFKVCICVEAELTQVVESWEHLVVMPHMQS